MFSQPNCGYRLQEQPLIDIIFSLISNSRRRTRRQISCYSHRQPYCDRSKWQRSSLCSPQLWIPPQQPQWYEYWPSSGDWWWSWFRRSREIPTFTTDWGEFRNLKAMLQRNAWPPEWRCFAQIFLLDVTHKSIKSIHSTSCNRMKHILLLLLKLTTNHYYYYYYYYYHYDLYGYISGTIKEGKPLN